VWERFTNVPPNVVCATLAIRGNPDMEDGGLHVTVLTRDDAGNQAVFQSDCDTQPAPLDPDTQCTAFTRLAPPPFRLMGRQSGQRVDDAAYWKARRLAQWLGSRHRAGASHRPE
jgi:hypothetical protein